MEKTGDTGSGGLPGIGGPYGERLEKRFDELTAELVARMNPQGFWTGELSPSALAVAVAVAALHFDDAGLHQREIERGLGWLAGSINEDGSYGDTPGSPGNISTTLLVYAAVNLYAGPGNNLVRLQERMAGYLAGESVDVAADRIATSVLARYGDDYTFSVPILAMCAMCGIPGSNAFKSIPQLPFELSLFPRRLYRVLNLSVVSYAIPALIAVGLVIFKNKGKGGLVNRIRGLSVNRALKTLHRMMPQSGGFLEAIPLTAFVSMSLINAGYRGQEVVTKGIGFLKRTQREDGSWPIDVDLSTWVTTLSIKALRGRLDDVLTPARQERLLSHIISVQNRVVHPFNGTGPGGWGWTNYSGSVPDCDDTPGAIVALLKWQKREMVRDDVLAAGRWLLALQNNDGGFPTFSRGWGKLPFDKSCADLTGHCLLALSSITENFGGELNSRELKAFKKSIMRAVFYLEKNQRTDGSWLPLWFGNQYASGHINPVYGTARVVTYLKDILLFNQIDKLLIARLRNMVMAGTAFIEGVQNPDGSWGGDMNVRGSIEETALAISALDTDLHFDICMKGLDWLDGYYLEHGLKPAPIGLYFASLWYDEKMYPLTAYLEAVTRMLDKFGR